MKQVLLSGVAGCVFGAGLVLSGMTQPTKVLGFLDVFGAWDPTLAFVMAAAVAVHLPCYRFIVPRSRPLLAEAFAIPARRDIDARLLLGAALFGVGWGLSGYCPGPSLVALAAAQHGALAFVLAFLVGTALAMWLERWSAGSGERVDSGDAARASHPIPTTRAR